jgi:hypothetical protein
MRGSVLLLVARPFRTSLTPAPESVEHAGARRRPGPLEDLVWREMTHRDTLEPVDGAGARNAVATRSATPRRGALHEPKSLDQVVGDRAIGLEPQHRQHGAGLGPAERKRAPIGAGFDRAEDVKLQQATRVEWLPHDSLSYRLAAQRPPGSARILRETGLRRV